MTQTPIDETKNSELEPPPERHTSVKSKFKRDEVYLAVLRKGITCIARDYFPRLDDRILIGDALQKVVENPDRNGELEYFEGLKGERRRDYNSGLSLVSGLFAKRLGGEYISLDGEVRSILNMDVQRFYAFYKMMTANHNC